MICLKIMILNFRVYAKPDRASDDRRFELVASFLLDVQRVFF